MRNKKISMGRLVFQCFSVSFMILVIVMTLYPFLNIMAISLSDGLLSMAGGITIFPKGFNLESYRAVLADQAIIHAFRFSVFRTVVGTLIQLMVTALAAYALSKKFIPGRTQIILYLYIPTLIGGGLIPQFILYRELGLMNNFLVYIVPGLFGFYNMLIMRTFFEALPESLEESARIDGASNFTVFYRIVLPLSKPVLATVSLFLAVNHWNDWFTTMMYTYKNENLWTLQYLLHIILQQTAMAQKLAEELNRAGITGSEVEQLYRTITPRSVQYTVLMIATLPIVVVYPFLQRYFVKGVMIGAVKS